MSNNQSSSNFNEEIRILTTFPKSFNPTDPERIKIFGNRLRELRNNASKRNEEILYIDDIAAVGPGYCDVVTQADLARKLHVTAQWVSDYEKGKKKSVPMGKLLEICSVFDATPHYLLGYSNDPDRVITFDEDGEIVCDDSGKPLEYIMPFYFPELSQQNASTAFSELASKNPAHFQILCDLLNSGKKTQAICFSILSTILRSDIAKLDI